MAEWAAYFRIEPDADSRVDSLLAQQLAMLGNINKAEEKTEPFHPTDFMPWVEKPEQATPKDEPKPISPQDQAIRLKALFSKKENI